MKNIKNILAVFGTRPEAIKMCPLVIELKKRQSLSTVVCVSGQHRNMLDGVLYEFGVLPDDDMNIMRDGQTLFDITTAVLGGAKDAIERYRPDIVLVHGDTSTAFAVSLAAFYLRVPVAHIEAGLRSENISEPFPEELNRRAIALMAKYHFAPTDAARQNLLREGIADRDIFVVGNTVTDALKITVKKDFSHPVLDFARDGELIFVTAHRRENLGANMDNIMIALRRIAEQYERVRMVIPMHKNPAVRDCVLRHLDGCGRVMLTEPLDVFDCHNIIARSKIILTDSGGIQEEAVSLGIPTLVLRSVTERAEGESLGTLRLVGCNEDRIVESFAELFSDEKKYKKAARAATLYGDGSTCRKIADILENITL